MINLKWFLIIGLNILFGVVKADVIPHVEVTHNNGITTIDFSELEKKYVISEINIQECASQPNNFTSDTRKDGECPRTPLEYDENVSNISSVEIARPGLYLLKFYEICTGCYFRGGNIKSERWRQFVAVMDDATTTQKKAIEDHAPLFSFYPDENYFPIEIESIFDIAWTDADAELAYISDGEAPNSSDKVGEVMRVNGHARNKLTISSRQANEIRGNRNNYPIYWFIENVGVSTFWATYFALFSNDEKFNNFNAGSHTIDRESVSIKFTDIDGEWKPDSVVYAGHLESQPTTFRGCADQSICESRSNTIFSNWTGGRTAVKWDQVSRIGKRPVSYVEFGSHAMYPGFGYFGVDSLITPGDELIEPAGSPDIRNITYPQLVQLDLANPVHSVLNYSGYLISAPLGVWHRIFPFVRYPTNLWASSAENNFGDCVRDNQGCQNYIHSVNNDVSGLLDYENKDTRELSPLFLDPRASLDDTLVSDGVTYTYTDVMGIFYNTFSRDLIPYSVGESYMIVGDDSGVGHYFYLDIDNQAIVVERYNTSDFQNGFPDNFENHPILGHPLAVNFGSSQYRSPPSMKNWRNYYGNARCKDYSLPVDGLDGAAARERFRKCVLDAGGTFKFGSEDTV